MKLNDAAYPFHEAACISGEPKEVCDLCGATQDRAIHSESYARENGYDWLTLDEAVLHIDGPPA